MRNTQRKYKTWDKDPVENLMSTGLFWIGGGGRNFYVTHTLRLTVRWNSKGYSAYWSEFDIIEARWRYIDFEDVLSLVPKDKQKIFCFHLDLFI